MLQPQTTVHGKETDVNHCQSSLNPPVAPPSTADVGVTFTADVFGQPHQGLPITLSNTKLTVSVPAATLQLGVDVGLITNGMPVTSTVNFVVTGSNTTEGSHTYTKTQTVTLVVGPGNAAHPLGVAKPLTATVTFPNTTWHPIDAVHDVVFSEKSLGITATLNLGGEPPLIVTATFTCAPTKAPTIAALSAVGPPPTTTTLATPVTPAGGTSAAAGTGSTTATGSSTSSGASGTLPRTGASVVFLVTLAALLIELGVAALTISGRKLRLHRHRY